MVGVGVRAAAGAPVEIEEAAAESVAEVAAAVARTAVVTRVAKTAARVRSPAVTTAGAAADTLAQ